MIKKLFVVLIISYSTLAFGQVKKLDGTLKLWYNRPAANWNEALPIGNGRLGAMVFGEPGKEQLQLNEETVWSGGPNSNITSESGAAIPELRKLLFEGKFEEAQAIADVKMLPKKNSGMIYQPVGNLFIKFDGHEKAINYYRDLNIEKAVATVIYEVDGVTYKREIFSSFPDQVMMVRLTASKPGKISFSATMDSPQNGVLKTENGKLVFSGITSDHEGEKGQIKFESQVKTVAEGGKVALQNNTWTIKDANSATVYVSIATNFKNYHDISENAGSKAAAFLDKAVQKNYATALAAHIKFYQQYFNRVKFNIGVNEAVNKPTDQRIAEFASTNDPHLTALYFQFGRYLLISSSQPGNQPPTLQGIWNDKMLAPWDSKYTININTEMNYWPAEVTNLSELHDPLFKMLKDLAVTGKETAKVMYGAKGWVTHHNTDLWRITGPVDRPYAGLWPMGGNWLSQHLWDHYMFTGDQQFLKEYYSVLKGACEFYLDVLQEEPTHKWLVVSPSNSPENTYVTGKRVSIAAGTTMDNQLLFDLFTKTSKAAEILKLDPDFRQILKTTIARLAPMQIGKNSQLQEWMHDSDRPDDKHRHVSHLYGLYPGNQISPSRTPELFDAARTSLTYRGDPATGWSMGWKVNFWARFLDGNHAYKLITDQLKLVGGRIEGVSTTGGGTYPNLFDAHPPFQIDGNFGCTAGIAEMLLQSHDGVVHLLPALPDNWPAGEITGLVARGGYVIDIAWKNNQITQLKIKSKLGGNCRLRINDNMKFNAGNIPAAKGINSNPFYETPQVKAPLISPLAKLNPVGVAPSKDYDLKTEAGKEYIFKLN
ncbi:MAG: glycoside hydrolase family 95 protein [Candidatus Pedobacter colombiensis]|uniref:Glycoside hydrolase family 95 protein n=1 Tax=Candidatus Pedobacter colombiensis TaxID=3121371 RepID=A0AAJ5W4W2_9SPHI|nr:glycoside hydrolase family 95 protein [Pedobacter sp.]WEK17630.1 MAG: glycoside hydrolase family 95 protein [Pedobacter sp.]